MKNECLSPESDPCEVKSRNYRSCSDCKSWHWEPAHPLEAYEGMTLHAYSVRLDGVFFIFCADLQGEHVDDTTLEEALAEFLREVDARIVDQSGGLYIKPSSFDFQLKELLKFLDSLVRDGSVVDWDTLTEHVLKYHSRDY